MTTHRINMNKTSPFAMGGLEKIYVRQWLLCAFACVGMLMSSVASAASFACEKAVTAIERTICQDKELSELDEYLGRYYAAAGAALGDAKVCLASDQRAWLSKVRGACKDDSCLKTSYRLRLSELDGLQPGATAVRELQLPKAPTLVAIIPPALDQVAAPRVKNLKPLSAEGKLANRVSTEDGYYVVSRGGAKHLLVGVMFFDDSTSVLESLSKETRTDYLVRGQAEPEKSSRHAFAQSTCRYIYRLPP